MKKNYERTYKKNYKKIILRMSLLSFNIAVVHIIHKILLLIKNLMNYLKDNIFKFFFRLVFQKQNFFHDI